MGLPGHRRTSSHKRRRAAHFALKKLSLTVCGKCKKPVLQHTMCKFCGTYMGRTIVKVKGPVGAGKKPAKAAAEAGASAGALAKAGHQGHGHG